MNRHYLRVRVISLVLMMIAVLSSMYVTRAVAQTPATVPHTAAQPAPHKEKNFLRNILDDQRGIWTAPFHWNKGDAKWLAPLLMSTGALIATDRHTSGELVENGDNRTRLRVSNDISYAGSLYVTGGTAAVFYLAGRASHNARARETGLLGAEALINSQLVVHALKLTSQRQRPEVDNSSGEFFDGGTSFPSGHAISAWSLATVIAEEYGHKRPLVKVGVYGLAAAVSVSRYTGRKHFLSDVLVGSALGYGIGRYVYHRHHDPALDALNKDDESDVNNVTARTTYFPRIAPIYSPRAHVYGATLGWSF